jgi:hypothetical protein
MDGSVVSLKSNAAGNFYTTKSIATPFTAYLSYQGKTRQMTQAQTDTQCAHCHSTKGANGAPGRIVVPK